MTYVWQFVAELVLLVVAVAFSYFVLDIPLRTLVIDWGPPVLILTLVYFAYPIFQVIKSQVR